MVRCCPNQCQPRHIDGDLRVVDNHISDEEEVSGHQVECMCCRMTGPLGGSEPHAIRLWNALPRQVNALPDSVQEALNSGDGTYKP